MNMILEHREVSNNEQKYYHNDGSILVWACKTPIDRNIYNWWRFESVLLVKYLKKMEKRAQKLVLSVISLK